MLVLHKSSVLSNIKEIAVKSWATHYAVLLLWVWKANIEGH